MDISSMSHLKAGVCIFEVVAALRVIEPILDVEMDEHDVGIGSNSIYFSTLISGLIGSKVFSGSMCDYFFSCGVVLSASIAVGIPDMPGMMPGLIVIALSMEGEAAYHGSDLVVVGFKVLSSFYVAKIGGECVTAAANDEIEYVWSTYDAYKTTSSKVGSACKLQHAGSGDSSCEEEGGEQSLTVHRTLFQLETVQVLSELRVSVGHVVILVGGSYGAIIFGVGVRVYLVGGISFFIDELFLHQILYMNQYLQSRRFYRILLFLIYEKITMVITADDGVILLN